MPWPRAPSRGSGWRGAKITPPTSFPADSSSEPKVLLADEPTGNLDSKTSREIMDLLVTLNRDQGITVIMVTHEPDMAAFAHRTLDFIDGRISPTRQLDGAA